MLDWLVAAAILILIGIMIMSMSPTDIAQSLSNRHI